MVSVTDTISTNVVGATSVELTLTTETTVTLYTSLASGTHHNSRVTLEFSPDNGTTWIEGDQSTNGYGMVTYHLVTTKVRVSVLKAEGSAATAEVFILAQ